MPGDSSETRLPRDGVDHINSQFRQKDLTGSDYDAHREWHRRRMRYSSGWANVPSWSQQKSAKPTHIDPENDRQADPALPSGSMSKTWDLYRDCNFWSKKSPSEDPVTCNSSDLSSEQIRTCQALLATPLKKALQYRGWNTLMSLCN